jgi:hypothetical protein
MSQNVTETQIATSASNGDTRVSAKSLSYTQQKVLRHAQYNYNTMQPNTFGQPIVLSSSRVPLITNIVSEVFNLSRSFLQFQVKLPAVANKYIWTYANTIGCIGHIQHYCNNNQWIVDLDNANNYLCAIKGEMSQEDLQSLDATNGLRISNSLRNAVPALRTNASIGGIGIAPSDRSFTEQSYFAVGGLGADVIINYNIPLRLYKNSFLSVDKDIYHGITSYLRIYWESLSKIAYTSDIPSNPSHSSNAIYPSNNGAVIQNFVIMLAQVDEPAISEMIKQQFMSGLSFFIPYPLCMKTPNSGTKQNIVQTMQTGMGQMLAKVFHQVYNNTESIDTAYDCSNNSGLVGAPSTDNSANMKVKEFWSLINGSRETNLSIDCTYPNNYDYMLAKRNLRGSCLPSLNAYQYNWVYLRDYCDFGGVANFNDDNEMIGGKPLTDTPFIWTFNGQTMVNNNYQHYQWFIVYKIANFNGKGCIVT